MNNLRPQEKLKPVACPAPPALVGAPPAVSPEPNPAPEIRGVIQDEMQGWEEPTAIKAPTLDDEASAQASVLVSMSKNPIGFLTSFFRDPENSDVRVMTVHSLGALAQMINVRSDYFSNFYLL